jgi:hypothetical protein
MHYRTSPECPLLPQIVRSDGGPCGLAGLDSGDCRRRLGGLGQWVMDWQRSTPRLAHAMRSRRMRSIGYRRAAGNTRGGRSSTGVRGPSCSLEDLSGGPG